jgi:hypothetical protein
MSGCVLCKYAGGDNKDVNEVMDYIRDNITKLEINEMAKICTETLNECIQHEPCTEADVIKHIMHHSQEHNILITRMLHEVRELCDDLRKATRTQNEDGSTEVNLRTASLYFKAVELAANLSGKIHEK